MSSVLDTSVHRDGDMNSDHWLGLKCRLQYQGNNLIWSSCLTRSSRKNEGKRNMRRPLRKALPLEKDTEAYRRDGQN